VARKNANGEGRRPRQRADGRWEARYWIDGKRHSVYGSTRKGAADKLTKAMANKDEPPVFVPSSVTVAEFFAQYEDEAKHTMKRRSFETLSDIARLHILPASGARWGELTGLFWSDLDLDRRVMHIQRSLINGYGGHTFDTPKSRGSRRSVSLTKLAVEALKRHRKRQDEKGLSVEGDALVFTNSIGKPIHASNFIRRNFKPLLKRAGLPDTNWHAATRHTCTCILLLEGVNPKSVAMQMGWSSVAFMLENYARFLPGWGDDGVMDEALGG
jgi:integrase